MASEPELWQRHVERELGRYREGEGRLVSSVGRQREQRLMRMGSAAYGAALALCMQRRGPLARMWFGRAAVAYRRSLEDAEPGSWGRNIGSLKARVLADDVPGAEQEAAWTFGLGAAEGDSTAALYAACLSLLALGEDGRTAPLAERLVGDETFPDAAATALVGLASHAGPLYERGIRDLLESFETREGYLEGVPVADTVLVLQAFARVRGIDVELRSHVLPPLCEYAPGTRDPPVRASNPRDL
jgi:hypothetical protein